jgi:hypothetical protein
MCRPLPKPVGLVKRRSVKPLVRLDIFAIPRP